LEIFSRCYAGIIIVRIFIVKQISIVQR